MFQIGDRVFLASGSPKQVWVACPDCLGEGRVKIILGGVEHWIDCCCCERGLESPGRIMTYEYNGDVQEIVIGGVESSQSNDGLEVRYRFNVTPHSWNSVDADKVFPNREDATIKAAELAVHSNREADENLQRKSNMKKSWAWNASYHRREIERAKKDLEYHTKKLNVASVRAKESSNTMAKITDKIKLPVRVEQHREAIGETGDYDYFWLLLDADGTQVAWWPDGDKEKGIAEQIRDSLNDIMRSEVDALIGQLRKAYESKETI